MKKSNVVILAILAVAAAFFLWLWYYLRFNLVDNPFDLVLAIVWWVLVGLAVLAFHLLEKKRQERVRTCYVTGSQLFNSERGLADLEGSAVDSIQRVLQNLEYSFGTQESPFGEGKDAKCSLVIRSYKFEVSGEADENGLKHVEQWEGKILDPSAQVIKPREFSSREELERILAA